MSSHRKMLLQKAKANKVKNVVTDTPDIIIQKDKIPKSKKVNTKKGIDIVPMVEDIDSNPDLIVPVFDVVPDLEEE